MVFDHRLDNDDVHFSEKLLSRQPTRIRRTFRPGGFILLTEADKFPVGGFANDFQLLLKMRIAYAEKSNLDSRRRLRRGNLQDRFTCQRAASYTLEKCAAR